MIPLSVPKGEQPNGLSGRLRFAALGLMRRAQKQRAAAQVLPLSAWSLPV